MIEDWDKIETEDAGIIVEYRTAMLKERVECQDVEAELSAFEHTHALPADARHRSLKWWLAAACIAAAVGFFFFYSSANDAEYTKLFAASDDLNLSVSEEGKVYLLNDAGAEQAKSGLDMSMQGNELVFAQTSESKERILKTPAGKIYKVTLPDGTHIYLNAGSKLKFPSRFSEKERCVHLYGEAFFEVAPDAKRPFIVQTAYFKTRVLGTKFNVRAYSKADASVVLAEGKVMVENAKTAPCTLQPEEEALLLENGRLKVMKVDITALTDWQNGTFYFDNASLESVLLELGRWYNMDVIVTDKRSMSERIHFVADRRESVEQAIKNLNALEIAHVVLHEEKILVGH